MIKVGFIAIVGSERIIMELKKTFGLFDALNIGIGAIIGAGIFVVTGIAAGLAGPALLLSLLIGAGISAFTALSFAELASLGFASYLAVFIPLPVNVVAGLACLAITLINYLGAKELGSVNNALVVLKLLILAFFVAFGIGAVKPGNFSHFMPNGEVGVMKGAVIIFFAYSGFATMLR